MAVSSGNNQKHRVIVRNKSRNVGSSHGRNWLVKRKSLWAVGSYWGGRLAQLELSCRVRHSWVEGARGRRLPDQSAERGRSKGGRDGQEDISGEKELTTGTKMLMCITFDKCCHLIEKTREEVYLGGAKYIQKSDHWNTLTGKNEKQHRASSVKDWLNKRWYVHIVECSLVITRDDVYLYSLAWKEHTIYCWEKRQAMKHHLSFNPIYQNVIFQISFILYICLGSFLELCSSKSRWFPLDVRILWCVVCLFLEEAISLFAFLDGMDFLP